MLALLSTVIYIQPGTPAAYAFYVLGTLSVITAVIVIAGKAKTWVRGNDPRRRDDREEA